MIYKLVSRVFYVIGVIFMFIPVISGMHELRYYMIPGGVVVAILGLLLMDAEPNKTSDDDILDNEF
jgi:hypothetical protein